MEGSLMAKEEDETCTVTSFLYHPCNFLEEAFRALFRCLGVEYCGTKMGSHTKEEKSSLLNHPSGEDPIIAPENTESKKTSQEHADPPSTASQINNANLMGRNGPRRSDLSQGSGPQHN